ncbi:MAG: hypothetical protein ACQEW0_01895 [Pseudomonadota bacterium]
MTGALSASLERISALLFQGGLERAQPINREPSIDMAKWHQKVAPLLQKGQSPGRLWEQLAGDLLLANLHQPQWGWGDTQSVAALDFWAEFEPGIRFLLLTADPQEYLAQCLLEDADESPKDERAYLEQWQAEHERLLAFYLKYPERCLLVNARQAEANLSALVEQLSQRLNFTLDVNIAQLPMHANSQALGTAPATLARYVAAKASHEYAKTLAPLFNELKAAQQPLAEPDAQEDEDGNVFSTAEVSLASLLKDYQRRCERDLSESDRKALEELKQENELLLLQLHQVQEEFESTYLAKQKLEEQQTLPAPEAANSAAIDEAKQENELLVLQLHQVQEELEHYFLQHQKTSAETAQLKQENRKLKQQYRLAQEQASAPKGLFVRKPKKAKPELEFEGIQLRNEQVNPDYEHLCISLQSPSFGDRLADQWHFRISCAGVKPGEFGQQPKLEIPEQSDQLLTNWFSESENEHGRKLELRFALPNAMDTGVWKQIQADDQQLIKALCQQLPDIVADLKKQNTYISRDWADWEALAVNMKRIHHAKASK